MSAPSGRGQLTPQLRRDIICAFLERHWRAARHGLDAALVGQAQTGHRKYDGEVLYWQHGLSHLKSLFYAAGGRPPTE